MHSTITIPILLFYYMLCYSKDVLCHSNEKFMYYAYGSNLLPRRLHLNNPTAVFYSTAKLDDYRLDFNMYVSSWNGAVSTIVEDPDEIVWGDLWAIDVSQMKNLDRQEGVDQGWYFAKNVTVTTPDGKKIVARTYQETHNPHKVKRGKVLPPERRPSNTYLEVIVFGAVESHLPSDYIGFLMSFPTNGKFATSERRKQLGYPFHDE